MSARLDGNIILLEGRVGVEDAEPLLGWLQADRALIVDMTRAEHLHTAAFQVLMALRPSIRGIGGNELIEDWILTTLRIAEDVQPQG